jgi:DNA-binding MarR family transcriptional regulator
MTRENHHVNGLALARMIEAMKILKDATRSRAEDEKASDMAAHTAMTFLYVAYRHPAPVPMVEIERTLGLLQTTNSRNIGYWAKGAAKREQGWDMLKVESDPFYLKRKLVTLTAKGEALAARISDAFAL